MSPPPPDISRLTYADLPQVIAIERRAFPTPWSLAMFVLELSKPSGICLAARHHLELMNPVLDDALRTAGMRRRYYQDNGEDALIMWRTPATLNGSLEDIPAAGPVTPTAPAPWA